MDRELIIRLAREAGFIVDDLSRQHQPNCINHTWHLIDEGLSRFAALVAAHEREECAKVVDDWYNSLASEPEMAYIAAEIRSRT